MKTLCWVIALFFLTTWTYGLIARSDFRYKNNVAAVSVWWVITGVVIFHQIHPAHLLWLFPVALIASTVVWLVRKRSSLKLKTVEVFAPALSVTLLTFWGVWQLLR